jgi:crotonobetainyl-CoA:carnitine CoA-transferase CaiB-like acyl-CoA transferase
MAELFGEKSRDDWCALLEGTDVCFAPVLNLTEAVEHPHNVARETFITREGVVQPAPAPQFSVTKPTVGACPVPGQHTAEIVQALGLDEAKLRDSGAI